MNTNIIETSATRIATTIKNANPEQTASIEVMKFALIAIIQTGISVVGALVISYFLGTFTGTVITLIGFAFLRSFSGGFHFKSAELCSLSSLIGAVIVPLIPLSNQMNLILLIVTAILITIMAPRGKNQSVVFTQKHYPLLKAISVIIVCSNFFIGSTILTVAFFIQALTLFLVKGGENS